MYRLFFQQYQMNKKHSAIFLRRCLLFMLCCAFGLLWSCGGEDAWVLEPGGDDSCNLYKQLRDRAEYRLPSPYDDPDRREEFERDPAKRSPYVSLFAKGDEHGCLVLYRADKPDEFAVLQLAQVALTDTGEIRGFNSVASKYDAPVRWKLSPTELRGAKLGLSLYVLRPEQIAKKDHLQVCKELTSKQPQCFPKDVGQMGDCWFLIKLQPRLPENSPFQIDQLQTGRCQICSREICGNNIDDNCNSEVDEGCAEDACHHPKARKSCYTGPKGTEGVGICRAGRRTCQEDTGAGGVKIYRWSNCVGETQPATEICNGLDDDCNGQTDEGLADCCIVGEQRSCYTGPENKAGVGICRKGVDTCIYEPAIKGGKWSGCKGDQQPAEREICDGKDNTCNGKIDDNIPEKPCQTGQPGICADGTERCVDGRLICQPNISPQPEICDGLDNDCNGLIDDVFLQRGQPCKIAGAHGPCVEGVLIECKDGKPICQALYVQENAERCDDGIDNNCNGSVDEADDSCNCKPGDTKPCYPEDPATKDVGVCKEGQQTCLLTGKWGSCEGAILPQTEICDGKDNNCNGLVDDDFPQKGELCFIAGQRGPCAFGRLTRCGDGPDYSPVCEPIFEAKPQEICNNGIDDDCDGVIDNSPPCDCREAGKDTQDCSRMPPDLWNKGQCKPGQQTCGFNGVWSGCLSDSSPTPEICDGKDNDCNGLVDESDPKLGQTCLEQSKQGICAGGKYVCENGTLECRSSVQPEALDLCDGKDNNCSGQIDDNDPDVGRACTALGKKGECAKGKLVCTQGKWECQSQVTAKQEECNGLDDDCDGKIDNNLKTPPCGDDLKGACTGATKLCGGSKGWLDCNKGDFYRHNTTYQVIETLCDGIDNDCDGKIDADQKGEALSRTCYASSDGKEGPTITRKIGVCQEGRSVCRNGKWSTCENAVLPQAINCQNGLDNDCNGLIDRDEPICHCTAPEDKGKLTVRTWGTGSDGSITITNRIALDKVAAKEINPKHTRSLPYVTYHTPTEIGEDSITLTDANGLEVNDEILLIHLQGDDSRIGNYEILQIKAIQSSKLTLTQQIQQIYGEKDNSSLSGQKLLVVRIPQYQRVYVSSSGEINVSAWDGTSGGILILRAQELIRIDSGGKISSSSLGYRGAFSVKGNKASGKAGESIQGIPPTGSGQFGGGHTPPNAPEPTSGGGGGYGTRGEPGLKKDESIGASGGLIYGPDQLVQKLFFGSGGGAGSGDSSELGTDERNLSGAGGSGGGILMLIAPTINVAGQISCDGLSGEHAVSYGATLGGGGGGSGGSLHIRTKQLLLYDTSLISAQGGSGGLSAANGPLNATSPVEKSIGGKGGDGRIDLRLNLYNGENHPSDPRTYSPFVEPTPYSQVIETHCLPPHTP
jgi:hypothetical protein